MEGWGLAFLGIIAFCVVVQTAAIVALGVGGLRLARQVREIDRRIERELVPTLENVSRLTKNLAEISERARVQAARVDALVGDVVSRVEEVSATVRSVVGSQSGWLGDIGALFRGVAGASTSTTGCAVSRRGTGGASAVMRPRRTTTSSSEDFGRRRGRLPRTTGDGALDGARSRRRQVLRGDDHRLARSRPDDDPGSLDVEAGHLGPPHVRPPERPCAERSRRQSRRTARAPSKRPCRRHTAPDEERRRASRDVSAAQRTSTSAPATPTRANAHWVGGWAAWNPSLRQTPRGGTKRESAGGERNESRNTHPSRQRHGPRIVARPAHNGGARSVIIA